MSIEEETRAGGVTLPKGIRSLFLEKNNKQHDHHESSKSRAARVPRPAHPPWRLLETSTSSSSLSSPLVSSHVIPLRILFGGVRLQVDSTAIYPVYMAVRTASRIVRRLW